MSTTLIDHNATLPAGESHPPTLLRLSQFAARHKAFSIPALRWMIFTAKSTGFDEVVVRLGPRRLFLDERKFFEWVARQQQDKAVDVVRRQVGKLPRKKR